MTINLQNNLITSIDDQTFGIQSLVTVDLSYNSLTAVPTNAFNTGSSLSLVESKFNFFSSYSYFCKCKPFTPIGFFRKQRRS